MKIRHTEHPLPSNFKALDPQVLYEADVKIHRHSRLALKLLVFKNPACLRQFCIRHLGKKLGRKTLAAVHPLSCTVVSFAGGVEHKPVLECDRRYYGVMMLPKTQLNDEIIAHECGHAAIYLRDRLGARHGWPKDDASEALCYPLGKLVAWVNHHARKVKFPDAYRGQPKK